MARPEGSCAGEKSWNAEHIKVFADVKKKHGSHSLTIDLDIRDEITQAEFFLVDGVIVTGQYTGLHPDRTDLLKAKESTKLPVIIGSGMTAENIAEYLPLADGFIVGSYFRRDGKFLEMLEPERLKRFMDAFVEERKRTHPPARFDAPSAPPSPKRRGE